MLKNSGLLCTSTVTMLQKESLHSWITQTQFHKSGQKDRGCTAAYIEYDNSSHEGRLFPLPAVVGWVAVVAGVCRFGSIFELRALEPGGS
jgi:hypothetical protein